MNLDENKDENISKIRKPRVSKNDLYSHEQDVLIAKMFKVLEPYMDNEKGTISLKDLESDELKSKLVKFIPHFMKFYANSRSSIKRVTNSNDSGPIPRKISISIIKQLIKHKNIDFFSFRSRTFGNHYKFNMNDYEIIDLYQL